MARLLLAIFLEKKIENRAKVSINSTIAVHHNQCEVVALEDLEIYFKSTTVNLSPFLSPWPYSVSRSDRSELGNELSLNNFHPFFISSSTQLD